MELLNNKKQKSFVEDKKIFKWWDYPVFIFLTILTLSAIFYFFYHWFSLTDFFLYPICYSIITFILLIVLVNNQGKWFLLLFMKKPEPMSVKSNLKVAAVTSFVPEAESYEMLEQTLTALIALDYSHDTWVLDEGDCDRVKKLCQQLEINHFSRKEYSQYQTDNGTFQSCSKHGNYNAWLYSIGFDRYDIISAFDPDHIPEKNFLCRVLGYFEDPNIGYVQAAQAYYNQKASFIARGAAEETYAYYSSVQMASYSMEFPIIIGSHNTHRVAALKQVGGFAAHDADDLLITLLYRDHGWKGVYVPEILAKGLTPVDWDGYLTQQRRWARSVLDVKFRLYPKVSGNLNLKSHIMGFLHGLNYLHKSFIIFLGLILMIFMLAYGISPMGFSQQFLTKFAILYGTLQVCEFYRQRFYLNPRREWGLHWRVALLQYAKWLYFMLAFFDVFFNRKISYMLTKKIKTKNRSYKLLWINLIIIVLICIAWTFGFVSGRITNPFLHFGAALTVSASLLLILTERINFPEPYDKQ